MATNLKVIIGKNKVFGTYVKTICFCESFTNEDEKRQAINNAKIIVFDYAESFGDVYLKTIHNENLNSNESVFEFLENPPQLKSIALPNQNPHNYSCKLVSTTMQINKNFVELVYSETNEGEEKSLELYFKRTIDGHFYTSRRYLENELPKRYLKIYKTLQQFVINGEVLRGHKAIVNL